MAGKDTKDVLSETCRLMNFLEKKILVAQEDSSSIWVESPVSLEEFCRDWIKQPLFDGPQSQLARDCFQVTKEDLPKEYQEIDLFIGKGGGKGHVSALILTYYAYLLLNMKDARSFLKIGKTAPIHLINVSYNSRQAKDVFFNGFLIPMVRATINPKTRKNYFEEKGVDLREDHGDIMANKIIFQRPLSGSEGGISAESIASDSHSGEGYSPLVVFVDEFSAMKPDYKAIQLVDKLETSATSRFGDYRKIIIASYKAGKNCKMSVRFNTASKNKRPGVYLMRAATWEFNLMKDKSIFQKAYDTDPVKAMMYYECLDAEGVDEFQFFKRIDKLEIALPNVDINPIEGDVQSLASDELKLINFKPWFKPRASTKYCIHIDLAKGTQADQCGFCMSHKEGVHTLKAEDIDKYINGEMSDDNFHVKLDFILQIRKSKTHNEIVIDDIRQFVYRLKMLGFNISVTLDGFQSLDFIQQLNQKGIEAKTISVDRDKKAYDSLRTLIYRDGLHGYFHPVLWRELIELEESPDGKKIDHPFQSATRFMEDGISAGSKDLSDALAGSVMQSLLCPPDYVPLKPFLGTSTSISKERYEEDEEFEHQISGGKKVISKDTFTNRRPENWNMPFLK